jgi:aminopeptidase YwaD
MKTSIASLSARLIFNISLLLMILGLEAASQNQPAAVAGTNQPSGRSAKTNATTPIARPGLCAACIKAHMEFLASDAMRGRGSGTADELLAAIYVGSQLRAYGIAPAGDNDSYIQRAVLQQPKLSAPPRITFMKSASPSGGAAETITWTYGQEFIARRLSQTHLSGKLRIDHPAEVKEQKQEKDKSEDEDESQLSGTIVLIGDSTGDRKKLRARLRALASAGAVAAIEVVSAEDAGHFQEKGKNLPELPIQIEGSAPALGDSFSVLQVGPDSAKVLQELPADTVLNFDSSFTNEPKYTRNALGILRGRDPKLRDSAVLLSAHLDHLGIGKAVKGDEIYNGADDDASGTTAVLELARVLGNGTRPRRTVIFALFGSEELGGLGSTYFRMHSLVPLDHIAANLEFEMLGRADPAVKPGELWLTGWERSNLGPMLAARGAQLTGDPHPDQNFFARSDNYALAQKGVVAQTVSSYGLHSDYHQPSDDIAHIDFKHMDDAIGSLLGPVSWLVNSSFTPRWNAGGKP